MDIYPQDLGPPGQRFLQERVLYAPVLDEAEDGWRAWIWTGLGLTGAGAAIAYGVAEATGTAGLGWLCFGLCTPVVAAVTVTRRNRNAPPVNQARHAPLVVYDLSSLRAADSDPFWRPYLDLVQAALNTPPPDVEAHASVRLAIRALGDSIAGLPPPVAEGTHDDPAAFQAQAGRLTAEADAEGDPVVAASLRRRAEALMRQAETAARTNTLLRRNEALRQEVAGQIAALQTSLTALRVGGTQAVYELAGVAASIQQVALEAGALTQARSEVGDLVNVQAAARR
jgi:hypothetical protein